MRSLFNGEILNVLQQQARHLESCFNNPDLKDEEEAHLRELANSRGKTLEQLKEDIKSYSQKLHALIDSEIRHQQLIQSIETTLKDEVLWGVEVYYLRCHIFLLFTDILDNYWDFVPVDYNKIFFRQLAYRIFEILKDTKNKYNQMNLDIENNKKLIHFREFIDLIQKSLFSAIEAALKVGALTKNEAATLRRIDLVSDTKLKTENEITFQPKSPLGKKLWEKRQKIFATGIHPLNSDEIEKEIADRRGEVMD